MSNTTFVHELERRAMLAESAADRIAFSNAAAIIEAQQELIQELRRQLNEAHVREATEREWASI